MSPSVTRIASSIRASAIAWSIRSLGMMQTGQPGPWMKSMFAGSSCGSPYFMMVWVWPPQTSMMRSGVSSPCASLSIRFASERIVAGSRKPS